MNRIDTDVPGVVIIEPQGFGDKRGYFMETYRQTWLEDLVPGIRFVQDNQSLSSRGTLRGLHYQARTPQGKLVRVVSGEVFDVAVDIRQSSPTFGKWASVHLSSENKRQFWVPEGFAHGFLVLSDSAELVYKCTDYYDPDDQQHIAWNDPDIGIDWPDAGEILLSEKDQTAPALKDALLFP